MSMNVSLTPQLINLVKNKVASGLYKSASEVIREALRIMEQIEYKQQLELKSLEKKIQSPLNTQYTNNEIKIISSSLPVSAFQTEKDENIDMISNKNNKSYNLTRNELWEKVTS